MLVDEEKMSHLLASILVASILVSVHIIESERWENLGVECRIIRDGENNWEG